MSSELPSLNTIDDNEDDHYSKNTGVDYNTDQCFDESLPESSSSTDIELILKRIKKCLCHFTSIKQKLKQVEHEKTLLLSQLNQQSSEIKMPENKDHIDENFEDTYKLCKIKIDEKYQLQMLQNP
ncbi:unnamed protein product [Heterobilharzia americana]|nr:unnamed protein product [Heterobilharzia americana]